MTSRLDTSKHQNELHELTTQVNNTKASPATTTAAAAAGGGGGGGGDSVGFIITIFFFFALGECSFLFFLVLLCS